jgi:CheY-like chemotaxis protein
MGDFVPKVLVADDNNNIQKMVSLALGERGVQVIAVGNGEAAVRRIPDLNPDLILADIFMPVRNGYEVCEFVKKDQRFSQIPVILLIGAFDPLDEKEARRVGADGILKKPFVPPDPLIAMVISTLEKNPVVAAELKRLKESKDGAEPHPLFELAGPSKSQVPARPEAPAKFEPKPLPNFPEPSPEEAALAYGFGTGKRAIDDVKVDAAKEQPAPKAEQQEAAQDDFDGAATSRDWRRTAMDFEVPAEAVNTPAFSSEVHFEAPVSAAPLPQQAEQFSAPHVSASSPSSSPTEAASELPSGAVIAVREHVTVEESGIQGRSPAEVESHDVAAHESGNAKRVGLDLKDAASASELPQASHGVPQTPVVDANAASESRASSTNAAAPPKSRPSRPHWMDIVEKATEYMEGKVSKEPDKKAEQPHASAGSDVAAAQDIRASTQSVAPAESSNTSASVAGAPEVQASAPVEPAEPASQTDDLDSFFAEEQAQIAPSPAPESAVAEEVVAEAPIAPAPVAQAPVAQAKDEFAVAGHASDPQIEADAEDIQPPISAKDPALVEPPAVRVQAEPLLVKEEDQVSGGYGDSHEEEPAPLYEFLSAQPEPSAVSTNSEPQPEASAPNVEQFVEQPFVADTIEVAGAPAAGATLAEEVPGETGPGQVAQEESVAVQAESVAAQEEGVAVDDESRPQQEPLAVADENFAVNSYAELTNPVSSLDDAIRERIPTMPPPNRAALTEIPFLNLPPGFDPHARDKVVEVPPENEVVDAVVQKILQRLEPQLQQMLSQGVLKPLIESVLNEEHSKRAK